MLPNSKDIFQKWPKLLAPKWQGQINEQPRNEAWPLNKSNLFRVTWGGLPSDLYVTCLKRGDKHVCFNADSTPYCEGGTGETQQSPRM